MFQLKIFQFYSSKTQVFVTCTHNGHIIRKRLHITDICNLNSFQSLLCHQKWYSNQWIHGQQMGSRKHELSYVLLLFIDSIFNISDAIIPMKILKIRRDVDSICLKYIDICRYNRANTSVASSRNLKIIWQRQETDSPQQSSSCNLNIEKKLFIPLK